MLRRRRTTLDDAPFAVVDVETTGLSPKHHDRVLEVAVVRIDRRGQRLGVLNTLVNPDRDVGPTHIHGITASDVVTAPRFDEIAGDVAEALRDAVFVAHNARFDAGFLQAEFERAGHSLPVLPTLCTLRLAYSFDEGRRRLEDCCTRRGIPYVGAHAALVDAEAAAALLLAYLDEGSRRGLRRLDALGCEPLELPGTWPRIGPSGRSLSREAGVERAAAEVPYLAHLVERLAGDGADDADTAAYHDLLDHAIEDRVITEDEGEILLATAEEWGLSSEQVRAAHRIYLRALVDAALADGTVSEAEKRDLDLVTRMLGLESPELDRMLAAPSPGDQANVRGSLKGLTVCFTGQLTGRLDGAPITRDQARELAAAAGLIPVPSVTKALDVLVVADPRSMSGKAKKARSYGTRIIAEQAFWHLIGVQVE